MLVQGHQTRETSTPPTLSSLWTISRVKIWHGLGKNETKHFDFEHGRDKQTDCRHERNNTRLRPPRRMRKEQEGPPIAQKISWGKSTGDGVGSGRGQ